ncbi:protein BIG GRAIN 1-like B [Diospyros lotus]|uniref:protein BIG GRAIN 1-like B n=1 Tax=Diospyros lotus TaxID=55363 RepID=UPI002250598E|nr:protein BIG GRAIN 1-like B [Diospyros lotus]
MDRCDKFLKVEDPNLDRRPRDQNPSFSSTLLDAIYRSIDDDGAGSEAVEKLVLYRETTRKKRGGFDDGMAGFRRACMIENWMEKKVSEKVVLRRMSAADFDSVKDLGRNRRSDRESLFLKSSSSSSDSSSAGGFSSSEAESKSSSGFTAHRPKPIRTGISAPPEKFNKQEIRQKPKQDNSFVKTKSKAMKIYGDLKKAKQPISPGGRLASFLNSLFTAGGAKKAKISSPAGAGRFDDASSDCKSKSTCSSASSFSRSCLSKTPSSRGKLSNGTKRSVRFYPVSVIVDEDCRPCGEKSLYEDDHRNLTLRNSINDELNFHIMEKNRRIEEAARDLLKNYQKKAEYNQYFNNDPEFDNNDDDEEDDAASYASSDLFELDNLSAIGIERYREELPVYETTHLDTNRAIANGFIS